MSKNNRYLNSSDVSAIANQSLNNLRIPIFVKKHNDEGLSFYYLGEGTSVPSRFVETVMNEESSKPVVEMVFVLDKPVSSDLYKYLTATPMISKSQDAAP
jgi:hypothetical protein